MKASSELSGEATVSTILGASGAVSSLTQAESQRIAPNGRRAHVRLRLLMPNDRRGLDYGSSHLTIHRNGGWGGDAGGEDRGGDRLGGRWMSGWSFGYQPI